MKIDNYTVATNSQYYNLEQDNTQAEITSEVQNFSNNESQEVEKVQLSAENSLSDDSVLSAKLSKAVLKNISQETNKSIRDRIESVHIYTQDQALQYKVKAYVQSDSRKYEFSLDISLSRSFTQRTDISVESLRNLKDPLILSLDSEMPSLSSHTFAFDIDSDGESDQISLLKNNSAFLALDKNANNIIDNGSELFGANSGNGFGDLAQYDEDANGWIDENDAIFNKLRIWKKSDSKDELIGLGEVGIGAIFLGDSKTPFSLKTQDNKSLGEIKSSSFFLYENGMTGVISQVDMAIQPKTKEAMDSLSTMQKGQASLNIEDTYKKDNSTSTQDKKIAEIQAKIKDVESKISKANDDAKASLEAQLEALFSQMMAILEESFT